MKKYIDQLIEILALCDTKELKHNQQFQELCERYKNQSQFDLELYRVKEIKEALEETVQIQSDTKDEVIEALNLLNQFIVGKNKEEIDICYNLILKGYSSNWSINQYKHFEQYSTALQNYRGYFFSYTERKIDPEIDNEINKQYKFLIQNILGKKYYEEADKKNENLLAKAINYLLENCGNNVGKPGFFYPNNKGDNQNTEDKLKEACEQCFVFIQLIQNIMFTTKSDEKYKNYCHIEYNYARKDKHPECFKFILAEESHTSLIEKRNVYYEYHKWYQEIKTRDLIHLEPTKPYKLTHVLMQKNKILKDLVQEIERIKWKIIEDIPIQ